jgi:hypothetical protein
MATAACLLFAFVMKVGASDGGRPRTRMDRSVAYAKVDIVEEGMGFIANLTGSFDEIFWNVLDGTSGLRAWLSDNITSRHVDPIWQWPADDPYFGIAGRSVVGDGITPTALWVTVRNYRETRRTAVLVIGGRPCGSADSRGDARLFRFGVRIGVPAGSPEYWVEISGDDAYTSVNSKWVGPSEGMDDGLLAREGPAIYQGDAAFAVSFALPIAGSGQGVFKIGLGAYFSTATANETAAVDGGGDDSGKGLLSWLVGIAGGAILIVLLVWLCTCYEKYGTCCLALSVVSRR